MPTATCTHCHTADVEIRYQILDPNRGKATYLCKPCGKKAGFAK